MFWINYIFEHVQEGRGLALYVFSCTNGAPRASFEAVLRIFGEKHNFGVKMSTRVAIVAKGIIIFTTMEMKINKCLYY